LRFSQAAGGVAGLQTAYRGKELGLLGGGHREVLLLRAALLSQKVP